MNKFKVGDTVEITRGREKGKQGKIEIVQSESLLVKGINLFKKNIKATKDNDGGVKDITKPIHQSKVRLVAPGSKKLTKVGFKVIDNKKVRFAKATGDTIK